MTAEKIRNSACFLFDLDGTVYLGDKLLPGAAELISYLDQVGRPYYFLTNNSSRSREDYSARLAKYGLDIPVGKIFSSGMAAAIYLKKQETGVRVFLVGTPSLEKEFRSYDFLLVDEDPDFAVLGFDTTLTYQKIWKLCDFIVDGVPFIATHPDINCPTEDGSMPDIGAMMAMIQSSTGKAADVVVGKPNPPIVEAIVELTGFEPGKLTMVGDRLYTDIAMGKAGIRTVLVLSGETKQEDVSNAPWQPDLVCENLGDLMDILKS